MECGKKGVRGEVSLRTPDVLFRGEAIFLSASEDCFDGLDEDGKCGTEARLATTVYNYKIRRKRSKTHRVFCAPLLLLHAKPGDEFECTDDKISIDIMKTSPDVRVYGHS